MALVPALPLLAAIATAVLGPSILGPRSHWPTVLGFAGAFVASVVLLTSVSAAVADADSSGVGYEFTHTYWSWVAVEDAYRPQGAENASPSDFDIGITLRADALTAAMLVMVTFVSSLVAIYGSGYMHGDRGYWRFFAYVSLFVFSMTMLVLSSNFLMLYVFWEAVGVCSYLLIGFWYEKPSAAAAGKKAFLVNRIGDFGFALGVFLIWTTYGTLNFHDTIADDGSIQVAGVLGQSRLADPAGLVGGAVGMAICLLLFVGACGKSAQFPLHVWLPDAMEGPTPVSALIHAATMVTAGVYLVARCMPLFLVAPDALQVVAAIGAVTALMAGVIAVTQNDLKRVLAYSTVSQLGYMFLALGTGTLAGLLAAMFHLLTHAFFKALLFLGAGSVMHAMGGIIDMRRFSGLKRLMPWTQRTFLVGCLALAGVFPFAGFFSKDAILGAVHDVAHHGGPELYAWLYWVGLFAALLTAFYTFRAYFLTFHGEERIPEEAGHHAHESPWMMTLPLAVLALFATVIGAWWQWSGALFSFLQSTPSWAYAGIQATTETSVPGMMHEDVAAMSTIAALSGIGVAAYFYLLHQREVTWLQQLGEGIGRIRSATLLLRPLLNGCVRLPLRGLYSLSNNKFYLDEIYGALIIAPCRALAAFAYWCDQRIVDGIVNTIGRIPPAMGSLLRPLQTGMIQFYALAMALGLLVLVTALLMWPAG